MTTCTPRQLATDILDAVIYDKAYSQVAIDRALEASSLEAGDRAFCVALVYGTLTYRTTIDALLDSKLKRGLSSLKRDVRNVLRLGVYQLIFRDDVPAHAAVNEAVEEARARRGPSVSGIVNGVLRNISRDHDAILQKWSAPDPKAKASRWGIPVWVAEALIARVGAEPADAVMEAFNAPTPVRVRLRIGTREALLEDAWRAGVTLRPHPLVECGLTIESGSPRALLQAAGDKVSIEDAGAQLAVLAAPETIKGPILDVCAGRGVKTLHMADRYPDATIVACDKDEWKLDRLREAFGERAVTTVPWELPHDAPQAVGDAGPYGLVMVDAPCSGFGTIGRHPEVRARRSKRDVSRLAELQRSMLASASAHVAPGGCLLYVVCTWTREEGPDVVRHFLESDPGAAFDALKTPALAAVGDVDDVGGVALWPDQHDSDGFYVVPLRRTR